jgi:hypothetical protein
MAPVWPTRTLAARAAGGPVWRATGGGRRMMRPADSAAMKRDRRAGLGPRREATSRTVAALAKPRVVGLGLLCLVVAVGLALAAHAATDLVAGKPNLFATGFVMGVGVACVPWLLWTAITSVDGSWSWRVGADAERWTAEELARLGPGWQIEHHLVFTGTRRGERWYSDIDHVAVGPPGVLAVSTKWTGDDWDLDQPEVHPRIRAAADQLEKNVRRLEGFLHQAVPAARIIPLLVCWGPGVHPARDGRVIRVGEVRVVSGVQADLWRPLLSAERLNPEQVTELAEAVRRWIAKHEDWRAGQPDEAGRTTAMVSHTRRFAVAATVMSAVSSGTLLLAAMNDSFDQQAGSVLRAAGGTPTTVMILSPVAFCLLAVSLCWRTGRRLESAAARRHLPTGLVGACAVASLVIWPLVLGGVVLTHQP